MKILSIDVGIKNLSYCVIKYENDDYKILDWNIIDLTYDNSENIKNDSKKKQKKCAKISLKDLSRNLYQKLEENKYFSEFDYVYS